MRTAGWVLTGCLVLTGLTSGCANLAPPGATATQPSQPAPNPTQPPPTPTQTGSVTISPQNAAVAPGQTARFSAASSTGGSIAYSVNGVPGGNATVGTINAAGVYTAPASISQSENIVVQAALTSAPTANNATATVAVINPGVVTQTANPLVAQYSIYLPQPGSMSVQFGQSNGATRSTWSQSTPSSYGGQITMLVAGMQGSSNYQLQGNITLANGVSFQDTQHPFTTGAALPTVPVQISTPNGQTPQPGIELFDTVPFGSQPINNLNQAFATDLQGNVIWTYQFPQNEPGSAANVIFPIKLLPNGHMIMVIGYVASPTAQQNIPSGTISVVREVDLAGNTIRELSIDQLNQSLAAAGYSGLNLLTFHTDVLVQPNGHWIVMAWMTKPYTNLSGYPGTVNVLGDVLVEVDPSQNFQPVWVWNSFDHLDINRHPYQFPDFTHSNAMLYSADDHNLLLSIRQQNWIVKINYQDGTGDGSILWHLGEGGDFKLVGGTDPTDWFYAQHGINFFSQNTSGVFTLGIMDNGNDRQFPPGVTCGSAGAPPCQYSTAPVMQIDENAKTATLLSNYTPPSSFYSYFGGQTDLLANGDTESDFCAAKGGAIVQEFQPSGTSASVIWQAHTPGYNQYRAYRLPSLYPGVQW